MIAQPLDQMPCGEPRRVETIGGERAPRRRLLELGLLPGTLVTLIRKSPLTGVVELEIRCCRFTLSSDQARQILVVPR